MQIHRSVKKRERQNKKRRLRNMSMRSRMKTLMKKVIFAVNEKREKDYIYSLLSEAISAIDKAGNKRVIHRNSANRKKSKLCRMVFEAVGAK